MLFSCYFSYPLRLSLGFRSSSFRSNIQMAYANSIILLFIFMYLFYNQINNLLGGTVPTIQNPASLSASICNEKIAGNNHVNKPSPNNFFCNFKPSRVISSQFCLNFNKILTQFNGHIPCMTALDRHAQSHTIENDGLLTSLVKSRRREHTETQVKNRTSMI